MIEQPSELVLLVEGLLAQDEREGGRTMRELAEIIVAAVPSRVCDLCGETGDVLRCNHCAQLMASDY